MISIKTRDHICLLTQTRSVLDDLAHEVRVRVCRGIDYRDAEKIIAALREFPVRSAAAKGWSA
jgi:hypothetical protein